MSILAARDLSVRLGSKAVLQGVSASFMPGQVTAVIGPNGAGKSTFLACLAGLRRPGAGLVTWDDTPLLDVPARERAQRLAFLPQIPEVAWAVDVRTLVGLGRTPFIGARGLGQEDDTAVDIALAATQTQDLAHRIVTTLSGGERTRVLLARALAGNPQWLLADEPLTGLDPGHQIDAAMLLRRLAHEDQRGIIITLHDLHMALRAADRVLVLAQGRIMADGPPAEALSSETLSAAYGVRAHVSQGVGGATIEIVGR
jgi:iron complex transport system ATP-binding protein